MNSHLGKPMPVSITETFLECILGLYLAVFVILCHFQTPVFTHSIYIVFLLSLLLNPEKNKDVLTFWHRNYFFNFSTPCI